MKIQLKFVYNDKTIVGSPALHLCKLVLVMMIIWLLLSGRLEIKFLAYGIATAVICSIICMPLMILNGISSDKKYFVFNFNFFKLLAYIVWLFWQLILANIEVAKAVVRPDLKIDTQIVRFKVNYDNPMALVLLANSITLTPGTVTMNVTDDGVYEIHALTEGSAEGIIEGSMQTHVARLFGEDENWTLVDRIRDAETAAEKGIVSTSKEAGTMGAQNSHKDKPSHNEEALS